MSMSLKSELAAALLDGTYLLDSAPVSTPINDLKTVLENRLSRYFEHTAPQDNTLYTCNTLEDVQLITAREALSVVSRIQHILGIDNGDLDQSEVPVIGTRDLSQIRTHLALTFRWGTQPLLARLVQLWPLKSSENLERSKFTDISNSSMDYHNLHYLVDQLFSLLFPDGLDSPLPQTYITTNILNRHVSDILSPAIALGWLPKQLTSPGVSPIHQFRPLTMRLLAILPSSQTIASLGYIISGEKAVPLHVYRACVTLLSKQLLRPDGVRGLCEAVFSEEDASGGDVPIEKLEHVARLLTTTPASMDSLEYYSLIIPKIISLLSNEMSLACKRAASFSLSRFLSSDNPSSSYKVASSLVYQLLHTPFLTNKSREETIPSDLRNLPRLSLSTALLTIIALISNTDPSPTFITNLLSPIVPELYSLLHYLEGNKSSDPVLKESLRAVLVTWGKIISSTIGDEILWSILCQNETDHWKVDLDGQIQKTEKSDKYVALTLLTPDALKDAEEQGEFEIDTNILGLYPDPFHFVQFLKNIDRSDISSDLFVKILEKYRDDRFKSGSEPIRILLYLQIIMQMQKQLSQGSTSHILQRSRDVLFFIKHILESAKGASTKLSIKKTVQLFSEQLDELEEYDSDDDMPDSERSGPEDELVEIALSLLLSILEADEDLSARTEVVLNDIFSLLEPLSKDGTSSIRPLAGEARMVMTARLAATSMPGRGHLRSCEEETAQEIYQKALKLLQDPILPVRAHGLLLLRQLVTPSKKEPKAIDHALIPSILSIFLQSIQDDDSYIFLNAIQGLAAMVDKFGSDVFKGLVYEYHHGLEGLGETALTQRDIDIRTRLGEALGIAIRRCGTALGLYVDIVVPPLFKVVRSPYLSTTLRTSSLSLLAECVKTFALAILPYFGDLFGAMIDLLQLESVPRNSSPVSNKGGAEQDLITMDSHPTSTHSKFPPLRRAAIHFISLLLREIHVQVQDSYNTHPFQLPFTSETIMRLKVTLNYIASTDEDNIARVMAREARDQIQELQNALLGL
ncbi:hypothetical protein BDQ17DRAFT_1349522 [Cyathus striatus]|nr:hypothetical protein BDQ17DRAFT_1349522 [Cyathus striatus]